jgi:hypothetical protein
MDELLNQLLRGEITIQEYNARKIPDLKNPSEIDLLKKDLQKGLGINTEFDLSKDLNISEDEFKTYTDRDIRPTYGGDYEDARAWRQSSADQWANGITKAVGKTATAVAGGLGMIPGLVFGATTGSFSNIWDNDYQRALDDANKAMDEALPNYVTNAAREYGVLRSMRTANFWANDMLQGASFVAGAVLTEMITGGMASGMVAKNAAKYMKAINSENQMAKIGGLAQKSASANKVGDLAAFGRQVVSGAFYEAGVEARHFVDEAKENFLNKFTEENGREPDDQELAEAMNEIYGSANTLFAANAALVSATNMAVLPRYFGPGTRKALNINPGASPNANWVKKVSDLSEDQLKVTAKNLGKSIDEVKKLGYVNKFDTFNKLQKAISYTKQGVGKSLLEGMEEGNQGLMNKIALDYVDNKLSNESEGTFNDLVDSFYRSLGDTYGNPDNTEFWKEVVIGGILGGVSNIKLPNKKTGQKFGLGITNFSKSAAVNDLVDKARNNKLTNEMISGSIFQTNLSAKMDAALEANQFEEAKTLEDMSMFNYISTKLKLNRFDEIETEITDKVNKMSDEEFVSTFGYENLKSSEIKQRKNEVIDNFKKQSEKAKKAYELAEQSNSIKDPMITESLGFVLFMGERIDAREESIFKSLQEKVGGLFDKSSLRQISNYISFEKETNNKKISEYKTLIKELERLTTEELKVNKNRTSTNIMDRGKQIDELTDKAQKLEESLEKDYFEYLKVNGLVDNSEKLKYSLSASKFKKAFDQFINLQNSQEEEAGGEIFDRKDVSNELKAIQTLAKYRQSQIELANFFFTQEGQKTLSSQIGKLDELYKEDIKAQELEMAQAQFLAEKRDYENMKEVAAEAYRLKIQKLLGIQEVNNQASKTIDDLNELNSIIGSLTELPEETKTKLQDIFGKLNTMFAQYELSDDQAKEKILNEDIKTMLSEIKEYLDVLQLINPKAYEAITENKIYNKLKDLVDTFKKDSKGTTPTFINPVNADPRYLQTMNWVTSEVTPDIETIKQQATDLPNKVTVKLVKESTLQEDGKFTPDYVFPNNRNKEPMPGDIRVAVGLPEFKTNEDTEDIKYSIHVMYDGKHIGYLNTPNKYKFGEELINFNPSSMEHLALLNPSYVKQEGDNLVPTPSGIDFINKYKLANSNFSNLVEELKKNPELSNKQLTSIFDINLDFSGMEATEGVSLSELSKVANGNPVTDLDTILTQLPEGIPSKGIIIHNTTENIYYLYDPIENKSHLIPEAYNSQLLSNFSNAITAMGNFKLAALYKLNDKSVFTVIKENDLATDDLNFSEILNENFQSILENIKQAVADKNLDEFFTKSKSGNVAILDSELYNNFRFTAAGTSYKIGFSLKKTNGIPHILMQLVTGKTYIELAVFNLNGEPIPYNKGVSFDGKTQGFIPGNRSFNFTKQGIKYNDKTIKTSKELLESLNKRINETFSFKYSKLQKEPDNKYLINDVANLSYQDNDGSIKPNLLQNIRKSFSSEQLVNELVNFKTLRLPNLKVTFTGKSGVQSDSIDNMLDQVNALDNKSVLSQLKSVKESLMYLWNNKLNRDTQDNYRLKYTNALNKLDKLILNKENLLSPTSTEVTTPNITAEDLGFDQEQKPIDNDNPYGDPFFSTPEEFRNLEQIVVKQDRLTSLLPDFITIKDIETIKQGLSKSGFTYGMFRDSVIYLSKNAPKGVEYHEAFHAVFRVLLTDVQIVKVLSEAKLKYGVPDKEQLNDLKSKSGKYNNLSKEQLTNLWYEEKLADEFMEYMNNAPVKESLIKKIFNRISQFINWLTGLNVNKFSNIDSLFRDISEGKFKNASKVKQSIIPLNQDAYMLLKKPDNSFLSSDFTNDVLKKVFFQVLDFKNNNGYITKSVIQEIINSVKVETFALSNYSELLQQLIDKDEASEALRIQTLIKDLNQSLELPLNINNITDSIEKMLPLYNFKDYDIDSELEDDSPTSLIQKSNQTIGGMESVSKKLRQYLMFTPTVNDPFGFKLNRVEIEALANENKPYSKGFINYIDGQKVHGALERMLVNTDREAFLNKFHEISSDNPELYSVYQRFVKDIYNDLKLPFNENSYNDILNIPITTLAKSSYFRMFVSGFTKHKVDSIIDRVDKTKGESKVHRSNLNDVKDNQFKIWYDNFRNSNFLTLSKSQVGNIFTSLENNLFLLNLDEFEFKFNTLKENFDSLGLSFSDKYIKLSIIHNNPLVFNNLEEGSELYGLKKLYDSYNDINYIVKKDILGIKSSISFSEDKVKTHHFSKTIAELEKDTEFDKEKDIISEDKLGAVGTIKDLAEGNSMFDMSASPSTFTNVNNEKVYNHLYPNYITSLALAIRNKFSKVGFDFIDMEFDQGFKIFKEIMYDAKLASSLEDDYVLEQYYKAIKANPLLNDPSVREIWFRNFTVYIADGLKSQDFESPFKGTEFADSFYNLDSRAKLLYHLNLFENTENNNLTKIYEVGDNKVRLYPSIISQNEGKQTQWAYQVPAQRFIDDTGELTNKAYIYYDQILQYEINSIREAYDNLKNNSGIFDKYDKLQFTSEVDKENQLSSLDNLDESFFELQNRYRGLKLTNFEVLKNIDDNLYKELITNILKDPEYKVNSKIISDLVFNHHFNEFMEFIKSDEVRLISSKELLLPSTYIINGEPDIKVLKDFFTNYFFNAASVNNLLWGNLNMNLKNSTDLFKRNAGPNAAGASQGFGESRVAVLNDISVNNELLGKTNTTDAQSTATISWYMNQYLPTSGKWNSDIEAIYEKILLMEDITSEELLLLQDNGALLNPRKTSAFTFNFYGKTSTNILTRKETSYVPKDIYDEFSKEVIKLLPSSGLIYGTTEYNNHVKSLQRFYQPRPNMKKLHDLLTKMENGAVDLVFFKSAVKSMAYDVQNINTPSFSSISIPNEFLKEQVITDSVKDNIVHGTQLMQLIWSEQLNDNLEFNFNGSKTTLGELRNTYKKLLGWRVKEGFDKLKSSILKNDKASYEVLLKSFEQSIIDQGGDPALLELFSELKNLPKYNLNFPRTLGMFEKMFLAFVSKTVFSRKTSGHKFTLRSDYGNEVIRDSKDKVITRTQFNNNPEKYNTYKVDRLRYQIDPNNPNVYYAECKIPIQLAELLEIGEDGFISSKNAEMLGIRIPTQDKHSMVYLKVVEVLPAELGPQIIMPEEIINLSGADFDIDSEFARALEHFVSNGKVISYGQYLNSSSPVKQAYSEYLESKINSSEVKVKVDKLLKDNQEYQDKLIAKQKNSFILKQNKKQLKELKKQGEDTKELKSEIRKKEEYVNLQKNEIDVIKFNTLTQVLKDYDYASNFNEFEVLYGNQVLNNIQKLKEGKVSEITPITVEEANNFMLDIEKYFVRNTANNNTIAMKPASDQIATNFMNEFYSEETGIKDPLVAVDFNTVTAVVKASNANAIGQQNIGIAALGNIMFQYLVSNKTQMGKLGSIDSYMNNSGERINDIISTIITMAVDNAKEQYAIRFNLTPATQSIFLSMITLKQDFNLVSAKMVQPALIEYSELESFKKSPIKSKKEENESNNNLEELLGKYYVPGKIVEDFFPEGITQSLLIKAKLYKQKIDNNETLTEDDLTEEQFKVIQSSVLNEFSEHKKVGEQLFNFSRVLSLIKGLKPSIYEGVYTIEEALHNLGLDVNLVNNKLNISHSAEYKEDPESFPIDFLPIINGDSFLREQITSFYKFKKEIPKFFLSQTDFAQELYDDIIVNIKQFTSTENKEKILRLINGYLTVNAFTKNVNITPNYYDFISNDEKETSLVSQLKKLKKDAFWGKNEFVRFLDYDKIKYENKPNNSLNNKTTYTLKTDNFANLSANQSQRLMDSFQQLYVSSDSSVRETAIQLLNHIILKDLAMYNSSSYISVIPPQLFLTFSNILNKVHENLLTSNPDYKSLFGFTKDELINDFSEKFIRDLNNKMLLKNNKKAWVMSNTAKALRSVFAGLNVENKTAIRTSGMFSTEVMNKIENRELEFTKENYEEISPIQWNEDGSITINIFKNYNPNNKAVVAFNKKVLSKIGLLGLEIYKDSKDRIYSNLLFPKGFNLSVDKSSKTYLRVKLTKSTNGKNVNAGVSATYIPVETIGSKLILPYAFNLKQMAEKNEIEKDVPEVIKESPKKEKVKDLASLMGEEKSEKLSFANEKDFLAQFSKISILDEFITPDYFASIYNKIKTYNGKTITYEEYIKLAEDDPQAFEELIKNCI